MLNLLNPRVYEREQKSPRVAGALKGEAEIKASLGKKFKNADEFIEHLDKP